MRFRGIPARTIPMLVAQPLGDFLVVAPGYHPKEFAINPGDEGWVVGTAARAAALRSDMPQGPYHNASRSSVLPS